MSAQAHQEGLIEGVETDAIEVAIRAKMWSPSYLPYRRADERRSVRSIASAVPRDGVWTLTGGGTDYIDRLC